MSASAARAIYGDTITAAEAADPNSAARRAANGLAAGREAGQARAALEHDAVSELIQRLAQLKRELVGTLAAAGASEFRRFTAASLIAEVDALLAAAQADLARIARNSIAAAAAAGAEGVDAAVRAVGVTGSAGPGLDAELVTAAFDNTADLLSDAMQQFRSQVAPKVRAVATKGDASAAAMRDLVANIDGYGLSNASFSAERIIRTEVGRTLNAATFARLKALAADLPFLRKGWRAARDGRTRRGHLEAAATYARGSGIPIADQFRVTVYDERRAAGGKPAGSPRALGVALLRFPIDPEATPAGRLAAGATILCRCNAFVDFNLADLRAYSLNRARGVGPVGPPLPPPPPPPPRPRRPPKEITAATARKRLEQVAARHALEKRTLQNAATAAYEKWYAANGQADAVTLGRLRMEYESLQARIRAHEAELAARLRKPLYVPASARRAITSTWHGKDLFGVSVGWRTDARGRRVEYAEGTAAIKKRILGAVREVEKLVGAGSFGSRVTIKRARKADGSYDGRAFAREVDNSINLDQAESARVVAHELGHLLEFNSPDIKAAVFRFYERRTAGYPLVQFKKLRPFDGYRDDEWTREDKFANIYAGKEYVVGSRRYATEILSLGIEWFYSRPAEFAREDPDYFDFIFDVLRGRF